MRLVVLPIVIVACGAPKSEPPAGTDARFHDPEATASNTPAPPQKQPKATEPMPTPPPKTTCYREAYGDAITAVERENDVWTVTVRGRKLIWDDGEEKPFETLLETPDLADQLSIPYPVGPPGESPKENDDPGRIRVEAFFAALYGGDREAVRAKLTQVPWLPANGKPLRFNREMGAAKQLDKVSRALAASSTNLSRYVGNPGGTWNYRRIAGTGRLSAHGFGIAIDINVNVSDYWRWQRSPTGVLRYRNQIPYAVVEVFEKHGFIWGGKWYHYDTMHFEYRPELLHPLCRR